MFTKVSFSKRNTPSANYTAEFEKNDGKAWSRQVILLFLVFGHNINLKKKRQTGNPAWKNGFDICWIWEKKETASEETAESLAVKEATTESSHGT